MNQDAYLELIREIDRLKGELEDLKIADKYKSSVSGWIYDTDTWTYVSATSFKIIGKNVVYRFPKGTKIKLVQSAIIKYFYVVATAYSTDTTVTVTGGSDYSLDNATISGQAYSYAAAPQDFPQWFNYTPSTYTGWSDLPTGMYRFNVIGKLCYYVIYMTAGTSNGNSAELDLPIRSGSGISIGGACNFAANNGIILSVASKWRVHGAVSIAQFFTDMASGTWATTGDKRVGALIIYEI